jgi:SpoVK/Ycf46/Vps4 family AAA+-type ATPase
MANAEQIRALVASFAAGESERFRTIALEIAASAAVQGDERFARAIQSLVERSRRMPSMSAPPPRAVPITQPEGELAALVSASYPRVRLSDMVLSTEMQSRLERVLRENRRINDLQSHGLRARRKLLLVGPPGCGKTMTASALAGELGLPLLTVQFHVLITRYMGETAAKLHRVFEMMDVTRGVYLFDEFDIIGASRTQANDIGEARRIVNSFLKMIESDNSDSLIVAATNHVGILDDALFRRFDDVLPFSLPDGAATRRLIENVLARFHPERFNWKLLAQASKGLSHAEIVHACEDAAKEIVLGQSKPLTTTLLVRCLRARKAPSLPR